MNKPRLLSLLMPAVMLLAPFAVHAQEPAADYHDFVEYASAPAVPDKVAEPVRRHIADLRGAMAPKIQDVGTVRDGLGLKWTVPCSELFAPCDTVMLPTHVAAFDILRDMLQYPTMYRVVVGVFADDTGDLMYREALTEARAQAVSDYLYGLSPVDSPNITVFAVPEGGETAPNNSIAARAANRRVEVRVVPEWQMIDMAKSGKLRR